MSALFFVERDFGKLGTAFLETDRFTNSRSQVIADIISGEIMDVLCVLEVNEDEGTCRDVTEDIARAVYDDLYDTQRVCPRHLVDWLDHMLGANTADSLTHPNILIVGFTYNQRKVMETAE